MCFICIFKHSAPSEVEQLTWILNRINLRPLQLLQGLGLAFGLLWDNVNRIMVIKTNKKSKFDNQRQLIIHFSLMSSLKHCLACLYFNTVYFLNTVECSVHMCWNYINLNYKINKTFNNIFLFLTQFVTVVW